MNLNIPSPIRLHGTVLSYLSTGTILPFHSTECIDPALDIVV
jgi:hypothetical protein